MEIKQPNSFAETIRLVESHVEAEIIQEICSKKLFYHTFDHALAVQRRALHIFQAIRIVLSEKFTVQELDRWESLVSLCGLAHDMVQLFDSNSVVNKPRRKVSGQSEQETADRLILYIKNLNQQLLSIGSDAQVLFSEDDQLMIRDAIAATVCTVDHQSKEVDYEFVSDTIYQPYLYNARPKISIIGSIIALADLGTLGMEGVDNYIKDGVLVFIEDNLDLKDFMVNFKLDKFQTDAASVEKQNLVKARLLKMTRFMVAFAHERMVRFEREIVQFPIEARCILRDKVFIHLSRKNIEEIEFKIPTRENIELEVLINFFSLH